MIRQLLVAGAAAATALGCLLVANPASAQTSASAQPSGLPASHGRYTCDNGAKAQPLTSLKAAMKAPAGFHPLTASDADLKKYGFPTRPAAGSPDKADWKKAMTNWKGYGDSSAAWTCPGVSFGPGGNYTTASGNWAGNADHASDVGSPRYDYAYTTVTGPVVSPDYNHCDRSVAAPWVGIGGGTGSGDELVQTGEEVNAQCGQSQWTRLWFEVYPYQAAVFVDPFSTGVGDNVYFKVNYDGGSCAQFYMESSTTGLSGSYSECFSGTSGNSAEWIVEKEGSYPLAQWSTYGAPNINFSGSYGHAMNVGVLAAGAVYHQSIYMMGSGGETAQGGAWTDSNVWSSFPVKRDPAQSQ